MRNWNRLAESPPFAPPYLTSRQRLPRHSFVVDQYVFASLHVAPNGRHHFIFGHVFGHYATRYLPFSVDPLDNAATAAPWLLDGRGYTAAAQMECWARQSLICVFQGVVLFPFPLVSGFVAIQG
jgi:hypothetical protein